MIASTMNIHLAISDWSSPSRVMPPSMTPPTTSRVHPHVPRVFFSPNLWVKHMAFMTIATQVLNIPIPMASTMAAGNPATSPLSMHFFIQSGMKFMVSMSNPKNVCMKIPMKNVPTPSVITRGASFAMLFTFFFRKAPTPTSTSPYPASPRHRAKNSRKNGASTAVGSYSL